MRLPIILLTITFAISLITDVYVWLALRSEFKRRIWSIIHISLAGTLTLMLVSILFLPLRTGSDELLRTVMWLIYTYVSFYVPKYIFVIFDIIARLPRLWHSHWIKGISVAGIVIGSLIFLAMWWGALFNRYNINVTRVEVPVKNLPKGLNGLTIAQISDLHVGTYGTDTTFISNVVDSVNALNADIIVFTGDIVNRLAIEAEPFVSTLSRLKAKHGVFAILGNHDYGDYVDWNTDKDKRQNLVRLIQLEQDMGWHLLNNDNFTIVHNNDTLKIVGVENVGDPPFHTYGDLAKAYSTPSDPTTKILLSHNPTHWHNDIAGHKDQNFALTLSGHTHAMQIELFGLSPAAWRYNEWGGLYRDPETDNCLYVNIGIGTVGIPARIGATPEITLITLRTK